MEKENVVSIWVGEFSTQEELVSYLKEHYDENDDMSSKFIDDFSLDYIDNQFMESLYFDYEVNKEEMLQGFSYVEQFKPKLLNDLKDYKCNSIIMVYNFCFTNKIKVSNGVKFVSVYCYDPQRV